MKIKDGQTTHRFQTLGIKFTLESQFLYLFFFTFLFISCFFFFKNNLFYTKECFVCTNVCAYLCVALRDQGGNMELDLLMVVSSHGDAEKQIWVFCKSSEVLNH